MKPIITLGRTTVHLLETHSLNVFFFGNGESGTYVALLAGVRAFGATPEEALAELEVELVKEGHYESGG